MARISSDGGAGFIGSHLCERFLNQGHEVLCMDNYSTGAKENMAPFLKNPRFRFIDHNVSRFIEVQEPLDYISISLHRRVRWIILELPIPTLKVGALGTHNTWLGKGEERRLSLGVDVRGLTAIAGQAAKRGVLGQSSSDRAARRIRRSQTIRRGR